MQRRQVYIGGAAASVVAWIVLAFVWALPKGWVHIPLALAAVLAALAIIEAPPREGRGA